jgi:hypothetical protein
MSPAHVRRADRQLFGKRDVAEQVAFVAAIAQVERARSVAVPSAVGIEAISRHTAGEAEQEREARKAAEHGHRIEPCGAKKFHGLPRNWIGCK